MLNFGGYTDKSIRAVNEDSIYMSQTLSLFLVADGVGGLNAGDVASQLVCEIVSEKIEAGETLRDSVIIANQHLVSINRENADNRMATTLVAVLFGIDSLEIVWVGDSRVYYFDNTLKLLTKDHSLVEKLFENGQIAISELDSHPKRNVITQALGTSEKIEISTYKSAIPTKGYFMLCSDGLHTELSPQLLCDYFRQNLAAEPLAKSMVSTVVEKKGKDNVSVVVIALGDGNEDSEHNENALTPPERCYDESRGCFIQVKQNVKTSTSHAVKTQRVASQSVPSKNLSQKLTKKRHNKPAYLTFFVTVIVVIVWLVFKEN